MGLQRFPYKGFRGINYTDAPNELDAAEARDGLNVQPINPVTLQGLKQRLGRTLSMSPAASISNIFWWPGAGMLTSAGGDIYFQSIPAGGVTRVWNANNTGSVWNFAIAKNPAGADTAYAVGGSKAASAAAAVVKVASTATDGAVEVVGIIPTAGGGYGQIVNWKGRLVICPSVSASTIRWSDTGNAELPAVADWGNNFLILADADAWPGICDMIVHQDSLLVFKQSSVYQFYNAVTMDNRVICQPGGINYTDQLEGAANGQTSGTVVSHPNGRFYWFSAMTRRIYSANLRGDVKEESRAINSLLETALTEDITPGTVVLEDGSILFNQANATRCLQLYPVEFGKGAWFIHDLKSIKTVMAKTTSFGEARSPYAVAVARDSIDKLFSGTSDRGVAISSFWDTSWRPLISEEPLERLRRIHATYGGRLDLSVFAEMTPALAPVAKQTYSLTEVTPVDDRAFSTNHPETRGRYHSFRIANNVLNKTFEIDELELVFRGGKEHT